MLGIILLQDRHSKLGVSSIMRTWLAQSFCQPVYESWLAEAICLGRVPAPGFLTGDAAIRQAYLGSQWTGPAPAPGQIDPLKEI